jgi:hypothetical protein
MLIRMSELPLGRTVMERLMVRNPTASTLMMNCPVEPTSAWEKEVERLFVALKPLEHHLATGAEVHVLPEKLFQGPIADALTHVGQVALLRRLAGAPVRGENYFAAEIAAGRVGAEQVLPKREFD